MPFSAQVLTVMIASPGDVAPQRDVVERVIHSWNQGGNAQARGVVLLPLRWEMDAIPLLYRGDGQQVINDQLVSKADVVIALFHTRLGTATPRAGSGTVEELEQAHARGITVRVWISQALMPVNTDLHQLMRLREFRETQLQKHGLVGEFANDQELAERVFKAINHDVAEMQARSPVPVPVEPSTVGGGGLDASEKRSIIDLTTTDAGLPLPPEPEAGEELLWSVRDLRSLIEAAYTSTERVTQLMDVLVATRDTYFSTSQLVESTGLTRGELRGALAGLTRHVRSRYPHMDGQWPFYWAWGPSIRDDGGPYPAETHYYASEAQSDLWLKARASALN